MENLNIEEMEATRGGFNFGSFDHDDLTLGNTATAVNVSSVIGSGNKSGGVAVDQLASANAGNIL
jgi:hypothetical protein